jgi:hypothetical protein
VILVGNSEYRLGRWIRPVSGHGQGELARNEWIYRDGSAVEVMDFAEVALEGNIDEPGQPENWRIAGPNPWRKLKDAFDRPCTKLLVESPAELWHEPRQAEDRVRHGYLIVNPPRQSLYVVRPQEFRLSLRSEIRDGVVRRKRRCVFRYQGIQYDLGLTDPRQYRHFEDRYPEAGRPPVEFSLPCGDDLAVCVSLAREFGSFHYKIVVTVFEGES